MTDITLYITGTIDFTGASTAIVGHGTLFTSLINGDPILAPDGHWYEITVTDDTNAVLDRNYAGSTVAGAAGGSAWVIFRSSLSRDSTRTASKQLTSITALYRNILNLTDTDQLLTLNKTATANNAGVLITRAATQLFQAGAFQDDDFSIRYLLASTWTKALGVSSTTGATTLYSQLLLGNIVTAPELTATTDNLAPANIAQANILRVSTDAARTLTGITSGSDGRVLALMNVGANELDLEDEGGTSVAANRFALPDNATIPAGGCCLLVYDGTASRWRQLSGSGSTGAGNKGWSPILAYVSNGSGGQVAEIVDWTGGEGTKPAVGSYIGPTGLVSTVATAVSVLGPKGDQVQFRMSSTMLQWSYVGTIAWNDLYDVGGMAGPAAALEWNFSTATADADPGASSMCFNNAIFGSITTLFFDSLERFGSDVSAVIDSWDDSTSAVRGVLTIKNTIDESKFAVFNITGAVVDATGYHKVPVTPVVGVIPPNGNRVSVLFTRTGDKGDQGNIGTAATVAVGAVTTGAPGSAASIANVGTSSAATFNIAIPQGNVGAQGLTGASYAATSTTSFLIATGSAAFTIQAGLAYLPGARVRAASNASGANYVEGVITAYVGTTLTVLIDRVGGSGTYADWNFNIAGDHGSGDMLSSNNLSDVVNKTTALDTISIKGADVASAATLNLDTATGNFVHVTGTVGITAITLTSGRQRTTYFAGALVLTASANLILPNGVATYTTAAGDIAVWIADGTTVRCSDYLPATPGNSRSLISAFGKINVQKFTSSGTYTPSANLLYAIIEVVGGGGAGGGVTGSATGFFGGGGGGAGGYSRLVATAVTIGASQSITIGAGGNGGVGSSNGTAGGDTSVGTICIAKGGSPGQFSAPSVQLGLGGLGGIPGTGDRTDPGAPGQGGFYNSTTGNIQTTSGCGGSSALGSGGGVGVNSTANGSAAAGKGGGGAGAYAAISASSMTGGAGAPGEVIITEFCSQ